MIKGDFLNTETYRKMDDVWQKLSSKLGQETMYQFEKNLVNEVNRQLEHKSFVKQHFKDFLEEIDVGNVMELNGEVYISGEIIDVRNRFFTIIVLKSSDEELVGKKIKIDEEIMSSGFDVWHR
jgi:hypothetical protein